METESANSSTATNISNFTETPRVKRNTLGMLAPNRAQNVVQIGLSTLNIPLTALRTEEDVAVIGIEAELITMLLLL